MTKNIILGIGNLLMKDDGIGIHIVNRLNEMKLPEGDEAIDGATFTLDLLPIFQEAEKILIVDAVKGDKPPGSVYFLEPQNLLNEKSRILSLHQIGFLDVIETAKELGYCADIKILGVEPQDISWGMELSEILQKRFDNILEAVLNYMREFFLCS